MYILVFTFYFIENHKTGKVVDNFNKFVFNWRVSDMTAENKIEQFKIHATLSKDIYICYM